MKFGITSGILTSLPGRYAKALFDFAHEKGQVKPVGAGLSALEKLIQSSPPLKKALLNPTLPGEEQEAVLKAISVRLKAPDIVQSFMGLLMRSQRIPYIHKIEKIYQHLASEEKGEQRIKVISAYPLTSSQGHLLKENLKKVFPGTLKLTFVNDAKVLGGSMIRAGSQVIDATLATHLNQLAAIMKGSS